MTLGQTLTLGQTYFGLFSMILFLPIMWYSLRIMEHFLASDDLSMIHVFEEGDGITAFRVLATTFLVYAITLIISGYGEMASITFTVDLAYGATPTTIGVVTNLDRLGSLIAFLGLAYFLHRIEDLTRL